MYSKYGKTKMFTWFFAFLTMFIIALVLILQVGFTVDAKTISGTDGESFTKGSGTDNSKSWSFDDSALKPVKEIFNISDDFTVLTLYDNPNKTIILDRNNIDTNEYDYGPLYYVNFTYQSNRVTSISPQINNFVVPETFIYDGVTYNTSSFSNLYFINGALSEEQIRFVVTNSDLTYVGQSVTASDGFCFTASGSGCRINGLSDVVINNVHYSAFSQCQNGRLICGNAAYYSNSREYTNGNLVTTNNLIDYNYDHSSLNFGGGGNSESTDNNLFMQGADWVFTNNKFVAPYSNVLNTGDIYPSGGNVTFQFTPTEFQISNSSLFSMVFEFQFEYDVKYNNLHSVGPFQQTTSNGWKKLNAYCNYTVDNSTQVIVPLSELLSNGNSKSWSWNELFDNLVSTQVGSNMSLSGILRQSKEVDNVYYNKFNLVANAHLTSASGDSGYFSEWYNPMSKQGYTTNNSGGTNPNPYTPDNTGGEDDESQDPTGETGSTAPGPGGNSGGGGSSNSSTGSISIVNNNTNNNNNNLNGNSSTIPSILKTLLGNTSGFNDEVMGSIGTNSWLTFVNTNFSSIGGLATLIIVYFTVALGILLVAFAIRMVFDLL